MLQAHHNYYGESMAEAEIARFFSAPTFLSTSARCGKQAERQAYLMSRVRMTEGNYANVGMRMTFAKEGMERVIRLLNFVHKCLMDWGLHSTEKTNLIYVDDASEEKDETGTAFNPQIDLTGFSGTNSAEWVQAMCLLSLWTYLALTFMWYIMSSLESLLLCCASTTFLYIRLWMMAMPQYVLNASATSCDKREREHQ